MSSSTAPAADALPASFLTIPCELRNVIYHYVFLPCYNDNDGYDDAYDSNEAFSFPNPTNPLDLAPTRSSTPPIKRPHNLPLLQTCHQVHSEATLLALAHTRFHLTGTTPYPSMFHLRASVLRPSKVSAIRHITLTTRIASLRAMNESWDGLPFGNRNLRLSTLTIVPTRADPGGSAYREVADLSQSHTLAYVFGETLKTLRNVGVLKVHNSGCFNEVVWKLVYRSTVYRMWRWGGGRCGVRFECSGEETEGTGEEWFCAWMDEGGENGVEVGEEVIRLVGASGELPADPREFGIVD